MKKCCKETASKIRKLLKELEGYEDMDLHDKGVIEEIKSIKTELNDLGFEITFEEIVEKLASD